MCGAILQRIDFSSYIVSEVRIISITSSRGARSLRASRRTATGEIVPASILRDAVLRTAPLDEVHGLDSSPCDLIGFMESLY
jgi:hypothetical protein